MEHFHKLTDRQFRSLVSAQTSFDVAKKQYDEANRRLQEVIGLIKDAFGLADDALISVKPDTRELVAVTKD